MIRLLNIYFFVLLGFLFCKSLSAQIVSVDGIPRDTSFTVHSAFIKERKVRPYLEIVKPSLPKGVFAKENIDYRTLAPDRVLHLNVYRPDDTKLYPALLMVHGGGWSSGSLSLQVPMAQQIADKGFVTIPVEYRLSPEALYPAALHDLKAAVRWVKANASEYNIDTTRIAISGCSAGGQLAMLVGMTNSLPEYEDSSEYADYSSSVHAVVNIDGISDFLSDELEASRVSLSKNKIPSAVKWFGGIFEDKQEAWINASPIYHITEKSAPVCFINSSIPRFHAGRDAAIEKLSKYKIYTAVYSIDDTPHTFWLFHPWFTITVDYMTDFLNNVLEVKKCK